MTIFLNLPHPIAAYFAADKHGTDAIVRCFSTQAVVKDEGQTYTGLEASKAWKAAASAEYTYRSEPLALERKAGSCIVTSRRTLGPLLQSVARPCCAPWSDSSA